MIAILGVSFLVLMLIGVPIAVAMGAATIYPLLVLNVPLSVIVQRMFGGMNSESLLAIPTFLLAGELMVAGRIADKIIRFSGNLIGHIRGGLANTGVVTNMIFAGVSGSAAADTAAVGSIMIPAMVKKGYPPGYAATLIAYTGSLGPIIPPSIMMVIYGGITGISIGKLFLAGAIPGILLGLSYILINFFWVPKMGIEKAPRASFKELGQSFVGGIWALIAPLIIILGILTGVFTPTEAGVIATLYSFVVGYFIYKGFKMKELPQILLRTCLTTAILMTTIGISNAFAWIIARAKVADSLQHLLFSITDNPHIVIIIIIPFLIIMGCFVETVPSTIIFVPVLAELGIKLGFDPIQFATVIVICLVMGAVTPPIGLILFISSGIAKISIRETFKYSYPFLTVTIIVILLVAFIQPITTFLPDLFIK